MAGKPDQGKQTPFATQAKNGRFSEQALVYYQQIRLAYRAPPLDRNV
jgi:hypothetical protein